jgi:hypothetical protein
VVEIATFGKLQTVSCNSKTPIPLNKIMTTIHLKDFMTKGKFGLVEIGMKIDEVIKYLGEPDWQNDYDTGFSEIGYSWYEFFYPTETTNSGFALCGQFASLENLSYF